MAENHGWVFLPFLFISSICKGWEKWVKSEHLCCNVSYFVLLLLCCSQALDNFSQNPALTLNLWLLGGQVQNPGVGGGPSGPGHWCPPGSRAWLLESSLYPGSFGGAAGRPWHREGSCPDPAGLPAVSFVERWCFSVASLFPGARWAWPFHRCVLHWPLARSSLWDHHGAGPHLPPPSPPSTLAVHLPLHP